MGLHKDLAGDHDTGLGDLHMDPCMGLQEVEVGAYNHTITTKRVLEQQVRSY